MSDGFSATFVGDVLNILKGTAPTPYTTVYVQLHTDSPGAAGTAAISAGSNARQAASFGSASAGSITLSSTPNWTNGGTSETVTAVSVWSQSAGGIFLLSGTLSTAKAWATGDTFKLSVLSVGIPAAT